MSSKNKQYYAVIAGLCASGASFFGKLSSLANGDSRRYSQTVIDFSNITDIFEHNLWIIRIICILLMIMSNAMVWTFFTKALHSKGGSLAATIISAASNYACSAILGCMIFGEVISAYWWCGTLLVTCGLIMLLFSKEEVTEHKIK